MPPAPTCYADWSAMRRRARHTTQPSSWRATAPKGPTSRAAATSSADDRVARRDPCNVPVAFAAVPRVPTLMELRRRWSPQEVATMAELTEAKRDKEPKSDFGLPEERKYPMPDKSHARNAKARASQQVKKGNLASAEKKKIDAKADRILDK